MCQYKQQDLVFSVKLHSGLIPHPLTLMHYPLSLPLVPLVLFLPRNFGESSCSVILLLLLLLMLLSQADVKSTPSPRPKTRF